MSKMVDLTGKRFERLLVVRRVQNAKNGDTQWVCQCNCGKIKIVQAPRLKNGNTKSCGCYRNEMVSQANKIHGGGGTRLYNTWYHMKERCENENDKRYLDYGGRGIKVCDEWQKDFVTFRDWALANGYKGDLTIERIDVNGDYCAENCTFVTLKEQANNKRNNCRITYNGNSLTLTQWCRELKLNYNTMRSRILLYGWSVEKAFSTAIRKRNL